MVSLQKIITGSKLIFSILFSILIIWFGLVYFIPDQQGKVFAKNLKENRRESATPEIVSKLKNEVKQAETKYARLSPGRD